MAAKFEIEQRTKAESDLAVAAASILAREAFIDGSRRSGKALGVRLGRGVSAEVKETAQEIVATKGAEVLRQVAKVHFRTAHEIAPDHFAAPPRAAGMAKVVCSAPEAGKLPALSFAKRIVETRLLILNADPVFQDRALAIFDMMDDVETRIVRTMPEAIFVLLAENFDGFVVEGESRDRGGTGDQCAPAFPFAANRVSRAETA